MLLTELKQHAENILKTFQSSWTFDTRDLNRPSADQLLRELVEASPPNLRNRLHLEFFGLGPLQEILDAQSAQEIVVNGPHEIWLERDGEWSKLEDQFLTDFTFKNAIDLISHEAQIKVDLDYPFADGRWRNYRIHLARSPLTHCEFHISFRRMGQRCWNFEELIHLDWCTKPQLAILERIIAEKGNTLFIGATGSGKTTILGACLDSLPKNERVVILEDTDEIARPNQASTKLLTRPPLSGTLTEVSLSELVRQSLRMRPSRIVMGEVRGPEAKDLLLALATGHSGSLGTLHANDPRQALLRLEMLIQLGAPQWSTQSIRQLIQLSVEYLVLCGNKNGHRRLEGLYRVAALESVGFLIEPLV